MFITAFTKVHHLSLSSTRSIQAMPLSPPPFPIHFLKIHLMLSSHLRQAPPRRVGGESGTNYQGPAVWKAARGTDKLHVFLSTATIVSFFVACSNYPFQNKPKSLRFIVKNFNLSVLAPLGEKRL